MKRVLVTGATGFTGRYLVPLLKRTDHEVIGFSRSVADIRDAGAVREAVRNVAPELVVHLAGTPSLPDSESETLFSVNAGGTENLLAACAALPQPPERILLASSCYVYGDTGDTPAREDAPLRPLTEYGRSKLEMENVARSWTGRLPIVIVRPFNYTGAGHGERFLVPKLVRAFKERSDDVSFVDPAVVRDFSDVRWVAHAYVDLLSASSAGQVFNVASGVATRLTDLIVLLERISGHSTRKRNDTSSTFGERVHRLVGSFARAETQIGRRPAIALETTLSWMYRAP